MTGSRRGRAVRFRFDGQVFEAPAGVSVAGGLLANGIRSWRVSRITGAPRGLFCGIGTCFDCLVDVNESAAVRACLTPLSEGDEVRTSSSLGGSSRG